METIEIKTLIDITDTGVRRITQGTKQALDQYRNYVTLNQCIEIASIITYDAAPTVENVDVKGMGFGTDIKGKHNVWTWRFYPDRAGAFANESAPLGSLISNLDQVPIIEKLTETINIETPVFDLTSTVKKNTILKIISGTE